MNNKTILVVSSLKTLKPRVIGVFEDEKVFEQILKDFNLTEKELVKFKKYLDFKEIQISADEFKKFYENKNIAINTFLLRINNPYFGGIVLMDKDGFKFNLNNANAIKSENKDFENIKYLKNLYEDDFITQSFMVLNEYSSDILKEEIELFKDTKYIIIERNLNDSTIQVIADYFSNANKAKKFIKDKLLRKNINTFFFNEKDFCFEVEHSINERKYLYQIYGVKKYSSK